LTHRPLSYSLPSSSLLFFFLDTAPAAIYTLSLHDALPISCASSSAFRCAFCRSRSPRPFWLRSSRCCASRSRSSAWFACAPPSRSEEHTSELQSRSDLVCRLLLEKKKKSHTTPIDTPQHQH